MTADNVDLTQWIGRTESQEDTMHASHLAGLSALLDGDGVAPPDGAPLLPTAHWLFFQPRAPQSQIGEDGHPKRGGFLPPVELPRRMWAGSRLDYSMPLRVGQRVNRVSEILNVTEKQGGAGSLVFVTVRHSYEVPDGIALVEEQDIVYRGDPKPGSPAPKGKSAPTASDWKSTAQPDSVMLFRYSALTFNGHRIHYDLPYAQTVEGYPGLVVHGPYTATLLIEAFRKFNPNTNLASFHYRAVSPLFCGNEIAFAGAASEETDNYDLWAANCEGNLAMLGRVVCQ